ncbi:hypothetical protein KNU66_gp53 [Gordonia phage McKinley]|uniref:Uncharacterized protein n=1 Tax=Gordonia phage McKinley TaxID=2588507 RepID=A0A4Y6EN32_9CAUD|nr:hypothetical protein KNU66_gp53 [Gordonia phage McKinley]QDF19475.1 hypothetical protein SEA_MCKINLEY_53 [Gordonia phage McKinley]
MMTGGTEHYDEALRLLAEAGRWTDDAEECRRRGNLAAFNAGDRRASREHDLEARESAAKARILRETAQVHATLAVAQVTAAAALTEGK